MMSDLERDKAIIAPHIALYVFSTNHNSTREPISEQAPTYNTCVTAVLKLSSYHIVKILSSLCSGAAQSQPDYPTRDSRRLTEIGSRSSLTRHMCPGSVYRDYVRLYQRQVLPRYVVILAVDSCFDLVSGDTILPGIWLVLVLRKCRTTLTLFVLVKSRVSTHLDTSSEQTGIPSKHVRGACCFHCPDGAVLQPGKPWSI